MFQNSESLYTPTDAYCVNVGIKAKVGQGKFGVCVPIDGKVRILYLKKVKRVGYPS